MEERRYDVEECRDRSSRPGALRRLIAGLALALLIAAGLATPWAQASPAAADDDGNRLQACRTCCDNNLADPSDRRAYAFCVSQCLAPDRAPGRPDGPCPLLPSGGSQ